MANATTTDRQSAAIASGGNDAKQSLDERLATGVALTAADASTVDGTYGTEEADVINNLRTRLDELEAALQSNGVLS